ncbi:PE domain-containing protein [Actinosynnema sp. CA-248983]
MPFVKAGGETAGPAAVPVTMQIEPDRILALKARYEAVRKMVQNFLDREEYNLLARPVAKDEVSKDAADSFRENANTAIEVTHAFIAELNRNIDQLESTAKTYNLVEDANTATVGQVDGGK